MCGPRQSTPAEGRRPQARRLRRPAPRLRGLTAACGRVWGIGAIGAGTCLTPPVTVAIMPGTVRQISGVRPHCMNPGEGRSTAPALIRATRSLEALASRNHLCPAGRDSADARARRRPRPLSLTAVVSGLRQQGRSWLDSPHHGRALQPRASGSQTAVPSGWPGCSGPRASRSHPKSVSQESISFLGALPQATRYHEGTHGLHL